MEGIDRINGKQDIITTKKPLQWHVKANREKSAQKS